MKAQGGQEEDVNSVHEESYVSNRSCWVRIDNGPHPRTARGLRRAWRAATRAAREMHVTEETQRESGETEWEKKRKQHVAHRVAPIHRQLHQPQQQQQQQQVSRNIMRVASEIEFQSMHPRISVSLHNERAIAVLEESILHLEFFQRDVADGMRQHLNKVQPEKRLDLHSSFLEFCERKVLSGLRVHSGIPKSEASALIDFATKCAKKLMVEPSATVGLGLNFSCHS